MSRYFIEVSYKGTAYSGFQVQKNSNTIQAEIEKAFGIFFREKFSLTGASRTDTGVHALQNFFHFDSEILGKNDEEPSEISSDFSKEIGRSDSVLYSLNAILPRDIVIKRLYKVRDGAHCRFDAVSRKYQYFIYQQKDPFLQDRAYFFPFPLDFNLLNKAAEFILTNHDFSSFSKKNTQVKSFICDVFESNWRYEGNTLIYTVKANRFLRGMVKGLVGTMLRVGTGKISPDDFRRIIEERDGKGADFSVPSRALFLIEVNYENRS